MEINKYEGLIAAPFTPMNKDNSLNYSFIPEYYNFLEKNGIVGAFINGSTGEGPSLTQKEKQNQADEWAKCLKSGGKVRIINMVGGTSYMECIENAMFSGEVGLSAIAVVAPYYYKPSDVGVLAEYVAKIGESVPEMPVYYYHIPVLTGVNFSMYGFIRKITGMLPNFAGIKFTQEDFMDFMQCLNFENGRYDLLWGRDENLLSALILGCRGAVGSTYNYAAPLYLSLIESFRIGDLETARLLQKKSVDMISLLDKFGGLGAGKSYMKFVGLDCGKFRLPVKNMTETSYDDFVKEIDKLNLGKYFSKKPV
jgi:N-acetylneuraminate lyase